MVQMSLRLEPKTKIEGQEKIIYDIIEQNQPIITAVLIGEGIKQYCGCPDKIARNLRKKGLVKSRKVVEKLYVEWYIGD